MHPNQLAFAEAIKLIFDEWTALKLAVELDWSQDGLAQEKREWFDETILGYFGKSSRNSH